MKHLLILSTSLLSLCTVSLGQTLSPKDSIDVMAKVDTVFRLFRNPDYKAFERNSTEKIYCISCFGEYDDRDEPYILDRNVFFRRHLKAISKDNAFIRASKSRNIRLSDRNDQSTIMVLFTIYSQNELDSGHEDEQLGIHFRKINGDYKFAGIETIP